MKDRICHGQEYCREKCKYDPKCPHRIPHELKIGCSESCCFASGKGECLQIPEMWLDKGEGQ